MVVKKGNFDNSNFEENMYNTISHKSFLLKATDIYYLKVVFGQSIQI